MYVTYVLYNELVDKIYVGHTDDLEKRIHQHNDPNFTFYGKNAYTKRFKGLWKLVYKEDYETRTEARKRETQLKSSRGRDFIHKRILGR